MHVENTTLGEIRTFCAKFTCFDKYSMKVGNDEVRPLFEAFGTVTECEVIKNYGSVSHSSFSAVVSLSRIILYASMGTFW